jgi:hypothetical protein
MDEQHRAAGAPESGTVELVATSGTSEDRVTVVWQQDWWDRSELEAARLNPAVDRVFAEPHREAVLTTPVCAGNMCHIGEVPMKDRVVGPLLFLNQSLDPTGWDESTIRRMAEELRACGWTSDHNPTIAVLPPSASGPMERSA